MADKPQGLWPALIEAQRAISSVAKAGQNTQQDYRYTTAEDVIREARQHLLAQGLVLTFSERAHEMRETPRVNRDTGQVIGSMSIATVTLAGELRHIDTGESYEFVISGEGMDTGDKALPKAYTNATKYGCRHLLLIPFGDDSEVDSPERSAAPPKGLQGPARNGRITDKQQKLVWARARQHGLNNEQVLEVLQRVAKVDRTELVARDKLDEVLEAFATAKPPVSDATPGEAFPMDAPSAEAEALLDEVPFA